MDIQKLSKVQQDVIRKAFKHLTEARDLFCCASSPFGRVKDQDKVQALFEELRDKILSLK